MTSEYALELRGVTKRYRGFALKNVSFNVPRGYVCDLIGPNGAGKTTVFNLLTKFHAPSSGRILFKGQDITGDKPSDVARKGMVRSFQVSAVFPNLTVLENVRVALQRPLGTSFHFWRSDASLRVLHDRAAELL